MHRALSARWLNRALNLGEASGPTSLPLFLCPVVGYGTRLTRTPAAITTSRHALCARRLNHTEATGVTTSDAPSLKPDIATSENALSVRKLPAMCSGCGAFTQTSDPEMLGYFDLNSKRIKKWMRPQDFTRERKDTREDEVVDKVLNSLKDLEGKLKELGLDPELMKLPKDDALEPPPAKQPVCDRCHDLQHYSTKSETAKLQMFHPTVETLRETIEESPYKYNHIYHVIDAADFPMSLLPNLHVLLGDIPLRSKNRRSRSSKYMHDRKIEMSFIITRSDLLGPKKEIVDSMMPVLREILREALGRVGHRVRLGNVRCVSARRGWWTKELREDIWKRGGATWLVGKTNVGKSQLFEAIFPKGRMVSDEKTSDEAHRAENEEPSTDSTTETLEAFQIGDLLPPPQPAKNYPDMPIVSSLPGTTASPIRVPFGNNKGELIDLPGLERRGREKLDTFVRDECKEDLLMKRRIVPEQISVKHGKSLILGGGLIRITPRNKDLVFLAYNFTPLKAHLTSTEKAQRFQEGRVEPADPEQVQSIDSEVTDEQTLHSRLAKSREIQSVLIPDALGPSATRAPLTFELRHDVTAKRAGPLTRKNAVGLKVENLPFRVVAADILIEGVGFVEVVAQMRAKDYYLLQEQDSESHAASALAPPRPAPIPSDPFARMQALRRTSSSTGNVVEEPVAEVQRDENGPRWPTIDVYAPQGKYYIDSRRPINGWVNNKPLVRPEHRRSRPRRSMKGQKKMEKQKKRASY